MARKKEEHNADAEDLLLIGRCGKAHGVKGEVKVIPETDDPDRFSTLETVYLGGSAEEAEPRKVQSIRFQEGKLGLTVVLHLESVTTRDAAEDLRGQFVFALASDLPPLDEDEFFLHDVVGLSVVTEEGEEVGTVSDVMEMPGQALFVVSRPGKPDAMVPAVPAFISEVDLESGRLIVQPIEGLFE